MTEHRDEEFTERTLVLDGQAFINCDFKQCTLIYEGGGYPVIEGCKFNACRFYFDGPAGRTLALLANMMSGGLADVVEKIFADIRNHAKAIEEGRLKNERA